MKLDLKAYEHVCKKAFNKLHALTGIIGYLTVEYLLMLLLIASLIMFPLIWMLVGKTLINKICKIHHRTHQVVYNEYNKSYEELFQFNNNVSIHQRHFQYFVLEGFKPLIHLNPELMWF